MAKFLLEQKITYSLFLGRHTCKAHAIFKCPFISTYVRFLFNIQRRREMKCAQQGDPSSDRLSELLSF